jgi:hypothetical protein
LVNDQFAVKSADGLSADPDMFVRRQPARWFFYAYAGSSMLMVVSWQRKRVCFLPRALLTTMRDFRRYPRVGSPRGAILAWQTANKKSVSRLKNIGLGGLYIRTPEPAPRDAYIQLLLDVPAGEVRARAVVLRIEPEGMAVKFVAMQPEARGRFARWLKSLV